MDIAIQPTIILLILSLITEKIVNFIKLQNESWANKKVTEQEEKIREKQIQTITIVVGVIVALTAKANLFLLFNQGFTLFWTGIPSDESILSDVIGSIVSGLFLSLGSKFFHDLLDMLLEVKNLKRKLNDKADLEFDNISDVDEFLHGNDLKKLKRILEETFKPIQGYFFSEVDYENQKIKVHAKKGTTGIQNTIPFKALTGNTKVFKIQIIEEEDEIITLGMTLKPSDEIANKDAYRSVLKGSISYPVVRNSDKKDFILTCYHAVWNEDHDWDIFLPLGKEDVVHPINGSKIGKIKFAFKNSRLDVALIELDENVSINTSIHLLDKPKSTRKIDETDKKRKTTVKINSIKNTNIITFGTIEDVDVSAIIKYPDGHYRSLNNLFRIKPSENNPFSIGGDSGSLIVDEWNYAVGIVVAGNEKDITFAIPINTIFDSLNIKIKQ